MLTNCPGLHPIAERPGFELATYSSQVQRHNHSATEPRVGRGRGEWKGEGRRGRWGVQGKGGDGEGKGRVVTETFRPCTHVVKRQH